jgi:hypothetical protein
MFFTFIAIDALIFIVALIFIAIAACEVFDAFVLFQFNEIVIEGGGSGGP